MEPCRSHSSASTLSPAIATSTRCSFQRSFPPQPLVSSSFRRCTAAYNECTPSRALRFFFLFPRFSFLLCPHLRRCPLIFRLLFLPSASSLPRARWLDLLSFLSSLRHFLLCTMEINEEHTSKQEKRRRLSCCKLKRTGAGLPCFSTVPSSYDIDRLRGWFRPPCSLHGFSMRVSLSRFVDRSRLNVRAKRQLSEMNLK